jgi:ubiquinone biosynthesis protein
VPRLLPDGRRLRPQEVVREYEKTLLDELNLLRESANAIQLRRNFEDSPMLYVPEVYSDYCSESMMVMERIYGIPVSDVEALEAQGTNMKLLAERACRSFHPGVPRQLLPCGYASGQYFCQLRPSGDPQYIGIDCGIVGSLNKEDKRYLAENFIAFFNRDYRKVAELHVDSGWVPRIPMLKSSSLLFAPSASRSLRSRWRRSRLAMCC